MHAAGYCIGGTALAALMAWFNREYRDAVSGAGCALDAARVTWSTSRARAASRYSSTTDTIDTLDQMMAQQGYLDGREMGRAFRMLRSNSLIWHYFVHNYLYGETPPPFDVLYWNTDVTRMPRAMHSFYLREFYLHNKLIQKDALKLPATRSTSGGSASRSTPSAARKTTSRRGGRRSRSPARSPHRCATRCRVPATSSASSIRRSSRPKRSYWSGETAAEPPDEWLKRQHKIDGSWWENWAAWLGERCGPKVAARAPGSAEYPVLGAAPGSYVHEI